MGRAIAALLCLTLCLWTVAPGVSHAPKLLETVQDHLEMIADHGHSHGFHEDLLWALHGHGHEAADHDHSHAALLPGARHEPLAVVRPGGPPTAAPETASRVFRIDRPPRA